MQTVSYIMKISIIIITGVGKIQGYRPPLVTRISDPGWPTGWLPVGNHLPNILPILNLEKSFSFSFNRSDGINGWNGDFNDGFIVFFTHINTEVLQLKHSILLNPKVCKKK